MNGAHRDGLQTNNKNNNYEFILVLWLRSVWSVNLQSVNFGIQLLWVRNEIWRDCPYLYGRGAHDLIAYSVWWMRHMVVSGWCRNRVVVRGQWL